MFARLAISIGLVLATMSTAHAGWKRATSDNFIVYSQGSESSLRRFAAKVEAFDSLLRLVTGVREPPMPNRLRIYLLRDTGAIQRLKRGRDVAGFYSPRLEGAIAVVPRTEGDSKFDLDGETVLFHEYAHHFMMQYFATAYPPWYVEGFAEYYSTAEMDERGTASIGKPAYHRAYGLSLLAPFPLERMLSADPRMRNSAEVEAYYGRAWLLTHMLSFGETRSDQLGAYLKAFADGVPAEKAAVDAFGPIEALEKELDRYGNAARMKYRKFSGIKWKPASIEIVELDAAEDALLLDRLRWRTGMSDDEQSKFLARVRSEVARYPTSPFALDLLADAEQLAGNDAEAAKADQRLLALEPDHGPALLRTAARLADSARSLADWKAVRALIVKANRADTEDPVALFRYYESFARQGEKPTEVAVQGLIKALELAPQAGEVRLALGAHLIADKRKVAARNVLAPLAFAPHGGDGANSARTMLASIDGEKPAPPPAPEPGDAAAAER